MNRAEAYMELLQSIQTYIETVHGADYYARDWILISGVENLKDSHSSSEIRLDTSPNTSNWSIYGLLAIGIDNFNTSTDQ